MNCQPKTFVIEYGPNRERLFDSLRIREENILIELQLEGFLSKMNFLVTGIKVRFARCGEKGNLNDMWEITVYSSNGNDLIDHGQILEGHYNTQTRKGQLTKID